MNAIPLCGSYSRYRKAPYRADIWISVGSRVQIYRKHHAECKHFPRVITRDVSATCKELFSNEIRNRAPCLGGEHDFEVDGFELGGAKE